jgi:putative ABC transport system permease protein
MSAFFPWRRDVRRDIDDELRFHFDARTTELVSQGMSAEAARAKALEEFGNVEEVRANLKTIDDRLLAQKKRADIFESLWYDARHAARSLWRTPAVSITIIVTLALGLGVNAAMFSLLDAILFRPPSGVVDPNGIQRLWQLVAFRSGAQYWSGYGYPAYAAVEQALAGRADLALYRMPDPYPLGRGEAPPTINLSGATASWFSLLGVRPALGRIYGPDEEQLGAAAPVVVISDRLWKREFNADRNVVGQQMLLSGKTYTVIGVTPPGFSGIDLDAAEAWAPLGANPDYSPKTQATWYQNTNINGFQILVRARAGSNKTELEERATLVLRRPDVRFGRDSNTVVQLGSILHARGPGKVNPSVQVAERASIVAVLVLVIAFANVVNLLAARAVRRRREIAVRLALGSAAWRLVRLLVSESLQLALLAAIAAMAAAWWGGSLLRTLLMPDVQWAEDPLHWRVLLLGVGAAILTGIGTGLVPALQSRAPDLTKALKTGAREGGARHSRLRSFLVVTQAALSVMLLVGAALFVQSLNRVRAHDIGYTVDRLAFVSVSEGNDAGRKTQISNRLRELEERMASVPGVDRVAYTSMRPKWGISFTSFFTNGSATQSVGFYSAVSSDYFEATGTRILEGRTFTAGAAGRAERAVLVNKKLADSLWAGQAPLGRCLRFERADAPCFTVIGVTQTVLVTRLKEEPEPYVYESLDNPPEEGLGVSAVVLRMDPRRLTSSLASVRDLLRTEFPAAKVTTNTMAATMEPEYRPWQLGVKLFTLFGVLAALVAAIGVYSSVSYAVSQRTHEFGVRVALGATWSRIVGEVVGDGVRVVAIGVIAGIVLALVTGRLIASLLYGVSPSNPIALVVAAGVLLIVAAVASLAPAWRAGRSDPVMALRTD